MSANDMFFIASLGLSLGLTTIVMFGAIWR